jgi:tetratricopeptide (TPR) repeat protein
MLADPIAMGAELDKCHGIRLVRDVALAAAGATKGAERAKHLDAALTAVASFVDPEYADVVQQLIAADPTNVTSLRAKYEPAALARRADAAVQNEIYPLIDRGEYPAAIARIDRLIGEINPRHEQLQLLLAFKGQLYFTLGDKHRAAEFLDSAIAVNPTSESAGRARAARAQILGGS